MRRGGRYCATLPGAGSTCRKARGVTFNQHIAEQLAEEDDLIILCGHYEGVDQRALDICGFEEMSVGDYVLTGGELAAMVIVDAVARLVPGVLGSEESPLDESFVRFAGIPAVHAPA